MDAAQLSAPWERLGEKLVEMLPPLLADGAFRWSDAVDFLASHANIWFAVGFLYLPLIFGIRHVSHAFKPFRPLIKLVWGLWNLSLTGFSIVGACFTAREFFSMLLNFQTTCEAPSPPLSGITAQWVFYFIVSKMFELGDSIFLALLDK
jgi:hypothetical protein